MSSYNNTPHWMLRVPVLRQLYDWKTKRFLKKCWMPKMQAALESGVGQYEGFLHPEEPIYDALEWLDEHIKAAAPDPDKNTQLLVVHLYPCSSTDFYGNIYPEVPPLLRWEGYAGSWWRGGRLQIEQMLPPPGTHDGILIVFNDTMEAFRASFNSPHPHERAQ